MRTIKVYTTPTCVFCHALMDWLDEKGVKYEEIDATKPENIEGMEIEGVPVSVITDEDGNETTVLGFDRRAIKKALDL